MLTFLKKNIEAIQKGKISGSDNKKMILKTDITFIWSQTPEESNRIRKIFIVLNDSSEFVGIEINFRIVIIFYERSF